MLLDQKQINEMSKDELRALIEKISAERAQGFERKTKARRKVKGPFDDLPKEAQLKLLKALLGKKEG